VRLSFSASSYYLSREGDKSKAYAQALYDPRHRVLAFCVQEDAWTSLSVVANAAAPPFAVAHADLAGVTTKYGIHIGSTVAQVEAVYGRTRLVQATGGEPVLSYVREIPVASKSGFRESPEGVETWFGIVSGRVASLSVGAGY
jgi:hypothetical protein